jgi:hypothetical protein
MYPDGTSMQSVCRLNSPVDILGEYRAGQAVGSIVRLPDNVVVVVELDDDTNRPENLLADDLHFRFAVGENGWLDEIAFIADSFATNVACGALVFSRLNVS